MPDDGATTADEEGAPDAPDADTDTTIDPAYAGTVFADLHPKIRALLADEGFAEPTETQRVAIPAIGSEAVRAGDEHVLLIAPTGTGKTEAAVLPILDDLLKDPPGTDGFHVLYITPLRALNRDLMDRLHDWGKRLGIDVRVRHGDTTQYERTRQSKDPPDVLITTPETVQVLFTGHRLRGHLEALRWVVVDEVHELAENERGAQLAVGLERVCRLAGEVRRVGLSATVGDPDLVGRFLVGVDREVRIVEVDVGKQMDVRVVAPAPGPEDHLLGERILASPDAAATVRVLTELLDDPDHRSVLVFTNTRERAEVLGARLHMADPDLPVEVHHGSLSKDSRVEAEDAFRDGAIKALVATSSMELGIDIGTADLVVQFNSPRQVARLVQRVGRAGHRADVVSNGLVIATDPDDVAEAAVIARRAMAGELERVVLQEGALDVIANQVQAMALSERDASVEGLHAALARAWPFRHLTLDDTREVAEQVAEQKAVFLDVEGDGGHRRTRLGAGRNTRRYWYENISMIPDERTFPIHDLASGRTVGTLDEAFVASYIEPGAMFICRGRPWRVAEVDDEDGEIRVSPIEDPSGAVPSWVGEEIPVPMEVAVEVATLRAELADRLGPELDDVSGAAGWFMEAYPVDEEAAHVLAETVAQHARGAPVPSPDRWLLEFQGGTCILHAPLGSRGNETLGRLVSALLTARVGTSVGLDTDPVRIVWELPRGVGPDAVEAVLRETDPETVGPILEKVLQNSYQLRYRLLHVARKFAAVRRDADLRHVNVDRLLDLFRGTPLYREAVRELLTNKFDVDAVRDALAALQAGDVELVRSGLTVLGRLGLEERRELILPKRADRAILEAVKTRLRKEDVLLMCLHCRDWRARTTPPRVESRLPCPNCGATAIAVLRPWRDEEIEAATKGEGEPLARLRLNAALVQEYGNRAALALVARGVGPRTAARILRKRRDDEWEFLRDVLEAEVQYARTRQFWD